MKPLDSLNCVKYDEIYVGKNMLYNIKSLYLQRVFHGIRFKVNNWRLAVRDGWLFSFIGGLLFPEHFLQDLLKDIMRCDGIEQTHRGSQL